MRLSLTIAALAAAAFAATAEAHEFKAGDLTIGHPYAIETPATAKSAAGYFSVTNAGTAPDRLVAIEADGADGRGPRHRDRRRRGDEDDGGRRPRDSRRAGP